VPGGEPHRLPLPAPRGREVARVEPAAQVVAAAGSAIVATAKVGRLLTRTGWGLARRLPGGVALQREVQRLQDAALTEVRRLLDIPEGGVPAGMTSDEQRAVMLIQNSTGREPLREAMGELLERSIESDRGASRDYLFGNIISQLVPDEARIMAALSDGAKFAAIDVVAKQLGRATTRTVLANTSTVGRSAGVVSPDNVPAYVTRLHNFGLVEFGPADDDIAVQFDIIAADSTVQAAQSSAEVRKLGSPKLIRKTLTISPFGREFWTATDPSRSGAGPR